jgi:hypothetical protein
MADISSLTNLQATDPIDWDGYADARESKPLPEAGRYTFQVAPTVTFPPSNSGVLLAKIDPVIVAPAHTGYILKGTKVSAKVFERGGKKVSFIGDLLRATGLPLRPTGDPQAVADAVEQTAGLTFDGDLDWEAGRRSDPWYTKGMQNFPKDPTTGRHVPYVTKKNADGTPMVDPVSGEPEVERAYPRITRFIPKV